MECLILHPAPPARMQDYFYRAEVNPGERSPESREFFDAMMKAGRIDTKKDMEEEVLLAEFQRKGWYLAACCECPLAESGIAEQAVAEQFSESVVKRVRFSYKPRRIALASRSLDSLMKVLQNAGFEDVSAMENWRCD
jgi:hypothetical protein